MLFDIKKGNKITFIKRNGTIGNTDWQQTIPTFFEICTITLLYIGDKYWLSTNVIDSNDSYQFQTSSSLLWRKFASRSRVQILVIDRKSDVVNQRWFRRRRVNTKWWRTFLFVGVEWYTDDGLFQASWYLYLCVKATVDLVILFRPLMVVLGNNWLYSCNLNFKKLFFSLLTNPFAIAFFWAIYLHVLQGKILKSAIF